MKTTVPHRTHISHNTQNSMRFAPALQKGLKALGGLKNWITATGIALVAFNHAAWAQTNAASYPSDKPIRILVGFPPGGSVDFVGRIIADGLAAKLKGNVVVENLGGAAGTIAALRVAQAPADGYTLLVGSSNELAGTYVLNPQQKYHPAKDFTPIGLVASAPVLFVAGPKTHVKTTDEFLKLVRTKPGQFSYGSSGVGSSLHFSGEMLKHKAGIFMTHIPYRGVSPLSTDLVGGGIEFAMMSVPAAKGFIESGRITALGVTSAKRLPALPNVPALAEHPALKGYDMSGWFAVVAPAKLPADITTKLQTALREILADKAIQTKMENGGNVMATGRENLITIIEQEIKQLKTIATFANIKE